MSPGNESCLASLKNPCSYQQHPLQLKAHRWGKFLLFVLPHSKQFISRKKQIPDFAILAYNILIHRRNIYTEHEFKGNSKFHQMQGFSIYLARTLRLRHKLLNVHIYAYCYIL